jgi:hypothetical protein
MGEGDKRLDITEQLIGQLAEHVSDEELPAKSA